MKKKSLLAFLVSVVLTFNPLVTTVGRADMLSLDGKRVITYGRATDSNAQETGADIDQIQKPEDESEQESQDTYRLATDSDAEYLAEVKEEFYFSVDIDGFEIQLTADAGVLPNGTEVKAKRIFEIDNRTIEEILQDSRLGENKEVLEAVTFDISLWYDEKEIQPENGAVMVIIKEIGQSKNYEQGKIFHIADEFVVEELENIGIPNEMKFEVEHFSVYGFVEYDYSDFVINENGVLMSYQGSGGDVVIPEEVTSIKERAFYDSGITNIKISKNVNDIGNNAFWGCDQLKNIIVDDANSYYCSDDGVLFTKSKTELIRYPSGNSRTNYEIPNSVISIEDAAFESCYIIKDIMIPDSVNNIGYEAFTNCSNLKNIIIPKSVTSIGERGFYACVSLMNVTLSPNIKNIKELTFGGCRSLTSITIPNGVSVIDEAFGNCSNLVSVRIPSSVISINARAFDECKSLTSFIVEDKNQYYSSNEGVLFNKLLTEIVKYPIGNARTFYEIPSSVTDIGYTAFEYCDNLTGILIPNSVINIDSAAFKNCTNLTNITIPNSVNKIGSSAFENCISLLNVTLSNSVKSIEFSAFQSCVSLKSVILPNSVTEIEFRAFMGCGNLLTVAIPNSVIGIRESAFENCENLTTIIIPNNVMSIDDRAFCGCASLLNVAIYNGAASISKNAFYLTSDRLILYGFVASAVEIYAKENNIRFSDISEFPSNNQDSTGYNCFGFVSTNTKNDITINGEVYTIAPDSQIYMSEDMYKGKYVLCKISDESQLTSLITLNPKTGILKNWNPATQILQIDNSFYNVNELAGDDFSSFIAEIDRWNGKEVTYYSNLVFDIDTGILSSILYKIVGKSFNPFFPSSSAPVQSPSLSHVMMQVYLNYDEDKVEFGDGKVRIYNYYTDQLIGEFSAADCEELETPTEYIQTIILNTKNLALGYRNKFYITMDSDFIRHPSGFGFTQKDVWNFSTMEGFERWKFSNAQANHEIPDDIYNYLFYPSKARFIKWKDNGMNGVCYGMSSSLGLLLKGTPQISSFNEASYVENIGQKERSSELNCTALEMIQLTHLTQYLFSNEFVEQDVDNLEKIYQEAKKGPILINMRGIAENGNSKKVGHTVLSRAVIDMETESKIYIYDCNSPSANQKFITLKKEKGKFKSWEFSFNENILWGNVQGNSSHKISRSKVTPVAYEIAKGYGNRNNRSVDYFDRPWITDAIILDVAVKRFTISDGYGQVAYVDGSQVDGVEGYITPVQGYQIVEDEVVEDESGVLFYWVTTNNKMNLNSVEPNSNVQAVSGFSAVGAVSSMTSNMMIKVSDDQSVPNSIYINSSAIEADYQLTYEYDQTREVGFTKMNISGKASGTEITSTAIDHGIMISGSEDMTIQVTTLDAITELEVQNIGQYSSVAILVEEQKEQSYIHVKGDTNGDGNMDGDIIPPVEIDGKVYHTVSAIAGEGGTITPSGVVRVLNGDNQTFNILADSGYKIADVFVNNVSVGAISEYTFNNVTADHSIFASFVPTEGVEKKHKLTVRNGTGTGSYAAGEIITIRANDPPVGKVFDHWKASYRVLTDADKAATTITMPESDVIVMATYRSQGNSNTGNSSGGSSGGGSGLGGSSRSSGFSGPSQSQPDTYPGAKWTQMENGYWKLLKTDGSTAIGWALVKDRWYYLNPNDGIMCVGWLQVNEKWYYLNLDGAMATGWILVNERWYYLDSSGVMLINTTTPDGYKVNDKGEWIQARSTEARRQYLTYIGLGI